jgi:hypothetical protein
MSPSIASAWLTTLKFNTESILSTSLHIRVCNTCNHADAWPMTLCTISKTSSLSRCKKIPFALIHSPNFEADKFKVQTLLLISPPVFSSGRFRSLHRKFGDTGRMHRSCHSHRIRFYVPLQSIGWWVKVRVQDEHLPAAHHCMHWMCMVELYWARLCPYYRYMPIIVELPGCSQPAIERSSKDKNLQPL